MAEVGESAVDSGHVGHGDFASAKSEGETITVAVLPGGDAQSFAHVDHFVDAVGVEDFDGGDVV